MKIIGREHEKNLLSKAVNSKKPELIAIYGRRRVGKTFLVRTFFKDKKLLFIDSTGVKNAPVETQIRGFLEAVFKVYFNNAPTPEIKRWRDAFKILTDAMEQDTSKQKIILFLDELPWMATKNSDFIQQLEYFWNQHWSTNPNFKLIVCGSAASWILDKIIYNKDGLYKRVTESIQLEPFDLRQTKAFLNKRGIKLNEKHVLDIYLAIGGVPYYLEKVEKGLSATQIIEKLAFRKSSFLIEEFETLFSSIFTEPEKYIEIIRTIADKRYGISKADLLKKLGSSQQGYSGLSKLKALEASGFILSFIPHFHKARGTHYRITDEFTMFYLKWIEPVQNSLLKQSLRKGYWDKMHDTPAWKSWSGYAFESVCYKHISQIAQALDLNPIAIPATWRYVPKKGSKDIGAQIDLLFDRPDDAITICEIKHTVKPFKIDKDIAKGLQQKCDVFQKRTKTDKQLLIAMITDAGIKPSMYSEDMVDAVVKLKDLFAKAE